MVLHSWVLVDLPSEGFHVEGLCAFDVVGRYLEMYYFTGHTYQFDWRKFAGNKRSLYFLSLVQASGSARVSSRRPGAGKFTALLFQEVVSGTPVSK